MEAKANVRDSCLAHSTGTAGPSCPVPTQRGGPAWRAPAVPPATCPCRRPRVGRRPDTPPHPPHVPQDGPQGLLLTSVMVLGGRTRRSAAFNTVLRSRVFPPVQLAAWTLHCLEEFGNMPYFLPYVYDRAASRAESSSVVLVQG